MPARNAVGVAQRRMPNSKRHSRGWSETVQRPEVQGDRSKRSHDGAADTHTDTLRYADPDSRADPGPAGTP